MKGIETFSGNQIAINSITIDWLRQYEKHMLKTKTSTSVSRNVDVVYVVRGNNAKKAGIIKEFQYPFGMDKYEIRTGEEREKALTLEQIAKIVTTVRTISKKGKPEIFYLFDSPITKKITDTSMNTKVIKKSDKPIFTQILQLIPTHLFKSCVRKHQSDKHSSKYFTFDQLTGVVRTAEQVSVIERNSHRH